MSRQANSSAARIWVRLLYSEAVGFAIRNRISSSRSRIMSDEVSFHRAENRLRRFAAAAHFAEPYQSRVGLDLNDRANESAPVAAVRVAQWRFQRHSYRGRPNVYDLH